MRCTAPRSSATERVLCPLHRVGLRRSGALGETRQDRINPTPFDPRNPGFGVSVLFRCAPSQ